MGEERDDMAQRRDRRGEYGRWGLAGGSWWETGSAVWATTLKGFATSRSSSTARWASPASAGKQGRLRQRRQFA